MRRLEFGVELTEVVTREPTVGRHLARHLARQKPAAERAVGEQRDALVLTVGQYVVIDLAVEEVARRLATCQRRGLADGVHLLGRVVADADRPRSQADPRRLQVQIANLRRLHGAHLRSAVVDR